MTVAGMRGLSRLRMAVLGYKLLRHGNGRMRAALKAILFALGYRVYWFGPPRCSKIVKRKEAA